MTPAVGLLLAATLLQLKLCASCLGKWLRSLKRRHATYLEVPEV